MPNMYLANAGQHELMGSRAPRTYHLARCELLLTYQINQWGPCLVCNHGACIRKVFLL